MGATSARLVDDVLPRVPVRQYVLSFPYEIRYRLAWDGELVSSVGIHVFEQGFSRARYLRPLTGSAGRRLLSEVPRNE